MVEQQLWAVEKRELVADWALAGREPINCLLQAIDMDVIVTVRSERCPAMTWALFISHSGDLSLPISRGSRAGDNPNSVAALCCEPSVVC